MAASGTTILRDKASLVLSETTGSEDFETQPLPWPSAGMTSREVRRPHGHRCVSCNEPYRCAGPDLTGECAPLCGPCLWVELGAQLRLYQSMAASIDRRRRKIEQRIGAAKCRTAQNRRMDRLRESNLVAGLGCAVLKHEQSASNNDGNQLKFLRIDSSDEGQ